MAVKQDRLSNESFAFPPDWQDDTRMNVMFAPFRPKSLDPVAWDSKMSFWTNLIRSYCLHHKIPVFSGTLLRSYFKRNEKIPACLETVIEELKRTKKLLPASDFDSMPLTPEPLTTWLIKAALSPLGWTINKVKTSLITSEDPQQIKYVYVEVAQMISDDFYKNIPIENKGKLIDIRNLCEKHTDAFNEDELLTVLRPLIQNKKAAATFLPELVVKFSKDDTKAVTLTEADKGIYQLKKNEAVLEEQVVTLEKEVASAMDQVRKHLKNGSKAMAMRYLRRKKAIEKHVEKRANALDNIKSLLDRLRDTESDQLVFESYKLGVSALKNTMASSGLSADGTDMAMDELQDVLDETQDIKDALSRPMGDDIDIDLEAELEALGAEGEQDGPGDTSGQGENLGGEEINRDRLPTLPTNIQDDEDVKLAARIRALAV